MNAPDLYLHLGLPKTASTSIQGDYLKRGFAAPFVLGKKLGHEDVLFQDLARAINGLCRNDFDIQKGLLKERISLALQEGGKLIISDESFLVTSYTHEGKISPEEKIFRLGKLLSSHKVRVVIVLRAPNEGCQSLYRELYDRYKIIGGLCSKGNDDPIAWRDLLDTYDFLRIEDACLNCFPDVGIKFIDFTKVKSDESGFMEDLGEAFGFSSEENQLLSTLNSKPRVGASVLLPRSSVAKILEIWVLKNAPSLASSVKSSALIRAGVGVTWRTIRQGLDHIPVRQRRHLPVNDENLAALVRQYLEPRVELFFDRHPELSFRFSDTKQD